MNIDIDFAVDGLTIANNGESQTIPLAGANAITLPNGSVVNPPAGKYWHIDTTRSSGGAVLEGTHGPLMMPKGSQAYFYVDNL